MNRPKLVVNDNIVIIPCDFHTGESIVIPGSKRKMYPSSDKRSANDSFTINGVIVVISGSMDHTLSVFFKGHETITAEFKSNFLDGRGDELKFSDSNGKKLLVVHLDGLDIYNQTGVGYEQLKRVIPHYTGRLMYEYERNLLKGGCSFGLLNAIAAPYDEPELNGYDVPEFFKELIFTRCN